MRLQVPLGFPPAVKFWKYLGLQLIRLGGLRPKPKQVKLKSIQNRLRLLPNLKEPSLFGLPRLDRRTNQHSLRIPILFRFSKLNL